MSMFYQWPLIANLKNDSHSLGYVVAAIVSTAYLNAYQFAKVGAARKAAKIPYPLS